MRAESGALLSPVRNLYKRPMPFLLRQSALWTLVVAVGACAVLFPIHVPFLHTASANSTGCAYEPAANQQAGLFIRHLPKSCSEQERERLSVRAGDILEALKEGKGIDLLGVVVTGDLLLNQLSTQSLADSGLQSSRLVEALQAQRITDVRIIKGSISLRDSRVHGQISTNLKEGFLVVAGPVTTNGTTFDGSVDLSHTAFLGAVDFSDTIFLQEGFFVRALFTQAARFERTAFGTHTRFHRAVFADSASFLRAGFNGLAEFLEVSFEKDTSFARTYFKSGTGFSGSRFHQGLDFSEATFEREVYFLFTRCDGDAYFRRATFRSTADFTNAEFKGLDDFSKTYFEVAPTFKDTKRNPNHRSLGGLQNPKVLLAIGAALLCFTLLFLFFLRKI